MKSNFAIGAKEVCIGKRTTYLLIDNRQERSKREIHRVKGGPSPSNPDEQGEVKGEGNMGAK